MESWKDTEGTFSLDLDSKQWAFVNGSSTLKGEVVAVVPNADKTYFEGVDTECNKVEGFIADYGVAVIHTPCTRLVVAGRVL